MNRIAKTALLAGAAWGALSTVALAQDGLSVLEVVVSVAVLAVVAAVAVALLRSTPVALAIDRP